MKSMLISTQDLASQQRLLVLLTPFALFFKSPSRQNKRLHNGFALILKPALDERNMDFSSTTRTLLRLGR